MRTLRLMLQCLLVLVVVVTLEHNWRSLEGSGLLIVLEMDDAPESLGPPVWSSTVSSSSSSSSSGVNNVRGIKKYAAPAAKFFLLAPNEYSSNFLYNYTDRASKYYQKHLNEESAEIWLHKGFARLTYEQGKTEDPNEADVILIAGYFHLNAAIVKGKGKKGVDHSRLLRTYETSLAGIHRNSSSSKNKPHLLLIPSWNPSVADAIGVRALAKRMKEKGFSNLWSVGFERNSMWQGVPIKHILPIPYVLRPDESSFASDYRFSDQSTATTEESSFLVPRISNFVFYAGETRRNAKGWAGCHRDKLILPLQNATLTDVRLVNKHNRLNQSEYNHRMKTSDYCLILCGDTPTSRSLTSAMVSGCIPIRIGSRLRGLCEPPCHGGFGWKPTGYQYPHLPFPERIPWDQFPEVDEQSFMDDGEQVLSELFRSFDEDQKKKIRSIMQTVKDGWIYGSGDPVNSTNFGDATMYIWISFVSTLAKQGT
jgi:hypothetical protein